MSTILDVTPENYKLTVGAFAEEITFVTHARAYNTSNFEESDIRLMVDTVKHMVQHWVARQDHMPTSTEVQEYLSKLLGIKDLCITTLVFPTLHEYCIRNDKNYGYTRTLPYHGGCLEQTFDRIIIKLPSPWVY